MTKLSFTRLRLVLLAAVAPWATADILFENEEVVPSEIYDLKYARKSSVPWDIENKTNYYCIFRSMWTAKDHPNLYPSLARWSAPFMFSHTSKYAPYIKKREAPWGVETIAEFGVNDVFADEIQQAGELVLDSGEGEQFFIDQITWENNHEFLPPIEVRVDVEEDNFYKYLSGIASIKPSPDWYSGFYLFDTVDPLNYVYWDQFKLHTYPWDAGTDEGLEYNADDRDSYPPELIRRFTPSTVPNQIFLAPNGKEILPVAEWECQLHTCPLEEPDCVREDWPPSNGCDVLKYPACNSECDPKVDSPCQQCQSISGFDPPEVWFANCCESGRKPKGGGRCLGPLQGQASSSHVRFQPLWGLAVAVGLSLAGSLSIF